MASHSFNTEIAKECGMAAAVVLNNLYYWCKFNEYQGRNFFDGRYWTYNSYNDFAAIFDYLTVKQIRCALDKLRESGYILVKRFNKNKFDQTNWYAVSDLGIARLDGKVKCTCVSKQTDLPTNADGLDLQDNQICPTERLDLPHKTNGFALQGKPIPYINTNINTDNKQQIVNTDSKQQIEGARARAKEKTSYSEFVSMTEEQHEKLTDKYGEAATSEMIEMLDSYKGSKGVKYKDDYRAILSWVVDKYREKHQKKPLQSQWQGKNNAEAGYRGALELLGVET